MFSLNQTKKAADQVMVFVLIARKILFTLKIMMPVLKFPISNGAISNGETYSNSNNNSNNNTPRRLLPRLRMISLDYDNVDTYHLAEDDADNDENRSPYGSVFKIPSTDRRFSAL